MVLVRDNYKCVTCGSDSNLHVHHITYTRLGKERLDDLVVLCQKCHKKVHDYHGKNAKYYPLLKRQYDL